jgi:hypothetical protein
LAILNDISPSQSAPASSTVEDPIVKRLIELHKKLEDAAKEDSLVIKGWQPLRISNKGWVIAGKYDANEQQENKNVRVYQTNEFAPIGEWKKAIEYLTIERELRELLFSDLTAEQLNAFRSVIGLEPLSFMKDKKSIKRKRRITR